MEAKSSRLDYEGWIRKAGSRWLEWMLNLGSMEKLG
jgi:hypothetical protein